MSELRLSHLLHNRVRNPDPVRQLMESTRGKFIIDLGLDPDYLISSGGGRAEHEAPRALRDAYMKVCKTRNKFHSSGAYSSALGNTGCRDRIADMEKKLFGMDLSRENIIMGMSSTQLTRDMFVALAGRDDRVMLLDPTDSAYTGQLAVALPDTRTIWMSAMESESWQYFPDVNGSIDAFHDLFLKYKPKVVLLKAPDNPTGQMPDEHLVSEILTTTSEAGCFLVMDYTHKTEYFGDEPPSYFGWSPAEYDNLVCIHSSSEWTRGLGRRLGWIEASPMVVEGMERIQHHTILCPDTLHQMVAARYIETSLRDGTLAEYVEKNRKAHEETAKFTVKAIDRHLGLRRLIPQGGPFVVVDVERDSDEFVQRIFKKTGVLFLPGSGFGRSLKNGIRISYGQHINNHSAIEKGLGMVGVVLDRELA